MTQQWWERDDFHYHDSQLHLAGQNLVDLARSARTPLYIYSAARMKANLTRLKEALTQQNVSHQIFFALKANRYLPLITYLKLTGQCGIDVCSPREMRLARQAGFREHEISYTGTSVSNDDLEWVANHPQVKFNCDSLSTLRRLGERCPGRTIGLRINPQLGTGYNESFHYAGEKPTKFGIYQDRYLEALDLAKHYNLTINTIHFHSGMGYLSDQLDDLDQILERTHWFLDQCPTIDTLDIGGGLGVPMREQDQPLDLAKWATIIAKHAKARNLKIQAEPGDYLIKDAGGLIMEVNTVEEKGGTTFVGVNGGFNLQNFTTFYGIPIIITPLIRKDTDTLQPVTIAGNINEAIDILGVDVPLPPLVEGDLLGIFNAGGYSAAMSMDHCMRGEYSEYLLV